jgi:hypothetical protein
MLCAILQNDRKHDLYNYEPKGRGFESLQPYHKKLSVFKPLRVWALGFLFCPQAESGTLAGLMQKIYQKI